MPSTPSWFVPLICSLGAGAAAQPLQTDPRLVAGTLDNGLRYIIRRHDNPPGRAAVWLHIGTGSLNETDPQRGIAHFLEHMAFNGSEHFPPGSVVPYFESLGLTFGHDQNAFTSFEQTTFQLALPDNKPETLDKAMVFMSDVAFRLSLQAREIDNERQIILEERRARLSGRQRVREYWLERIAPGSRLGQRLPIGTEQTITGVAEKDFREYYTSWYVPGDMTVIVVADMDPATVIADITEQFGQAPKRPVLKDLDPGIKPYEQPRAIVASDAELTDAEVSIAWIGPAQVPTTTVPLYRRDLIEGIATWCFNRRLQRKVAEGKMTFLGGGASFEDVFASATLSQVKATGEAGKWRAMLGDVATELQRARLHGFTDQEVGDARKEILANAERAVETEATLPAEAIIGGINRDLTNGTTITAAAEDLRVIKDLLPGIAAAEIGARFNEIFDAGKPATFSLQMGSSGSVASEAELIEAGTKALDVKPEAEETAARAAALMEKAPEPALLTDFAEEPRSHVWSGWLGNGARVHYRFMDYRKDSATVVVTVAGGEIRETAENRGITQAATLAFSRPATDTLSSTAIRDLMTGKKVRVGGGAGPDALVLSAGGSPADLETGLQLVHLLLTAPVIEQAGFEQWREGQHLAIAQRKLDARGNAKELLARTLYPEGDARTRLLEIAQVDRLAAPAAQEWLRGIIASGPIEVAVIGDIDRDRAMELVRRYIGSLPARARIGPETLAELRGIKPNAGPMSAHEDVKTKTDKSVVLTGFLGVDARELTDVRLMNMATKILTTRANQEIREEKQLIYSPSVDSAPGVEYPALGMVALAGETAPEKVPALLAGVDQLFVAFAQTGPTPDEMETARKQFANTFDQQLRDPSYWADTLRALTLRGRTVEAVLDAPTAYQGFTADQVRETFSRYFRPERTFRISVSPVR